MSCIVFCPLKANPWRLKNKSCNRNEPKQYTNTWQITQRSDMQITVEITQTYDPLKFAIARSNGSTLLFNIPPYNTGWSALHKHERSDKKVTLFRFSFRWHDSINTRNRRIRQYKAQKYIHYTQDDTVFIFSFAWYILQEFDQSQCAYWEI